VLFSRRRHRPLLVNDSVENISLLPGLKSWDHYSPADWQFKNLARVIETKARSAEGGRFGLSGRTVHEATDKAKPSSRLFHC